MKVPPDQTREQQSSNTPDMVKEPGNGGSAVIADNRPATVYQRKLRETMNAYVAGKALPVQCKPDKSEQVNKLKHGEWINKQLKGTNRTWEDKKAEEKAGEEPEKINSAALHDGVEETGRTNRRRVYQSMEYYKKTPARSFASPFPSSYLHTVVRYREPELMEYRVKNENTKFYTAVKKASVGNILQEGLDPNYGNTAQPVTPAQYNTRGFNYFGLDTKVPKIYGQQFLKNDYEILTFNMPKDTTFEVDPEIHNGCRTQTHISPEWFVYPKVENLL